MSRPLALLLLGIATMVPFPVRAEHAKIDLDAIAPSGHQTAHVDQTPPDWGKNPRPVVEAKVGEPIRVRWLLTNVYPHKTLEQVVVHFYVARQDLVGQNELPVLDDAVVLETALDVDLKPGAHVGARTTVRIDDPGAYLIRIETRQTGSDHEHFAAIDLRVTERAP